MKILTIGDLNAVRERAAKILLPREESNRSADGKCCGLDTGIGHMQILICGGTGCKASSSYLIYEKIRELLEDFLQPGFLSAVASGSVSADKMKKLKLRPVLAGGRVRYQAEKWIGNQVFHENMDREAMISFLEELMGPVFRQLQLESEEKSGSLLVSKKGKATIHVRKKTTPSKAG